MAGCGRVCAGWRRRESEKEMILIKEIVGCVNLIRFSVPLTDIIVLIGSFVSFTHSVDVTVEVLSACLIVSSALSLSAGSSVSLYLYCIISVFVSVSASLRAELQNDSLLRRYKSCSSLQPPRKYTLFPGMF